MVYLGLVIVVLTPGMLSDDALGARQPCFAFASSLPDVSKAIVGPGMPEMPGEYQESDTPPEFLARAPSWGKQRFTAAAALFHLAVADSEQSPEPPSINTLRRLRLLARSSECEFCLSK